MPMVNKEFAIRGFWFRYEAKYSDDGVLHKYGKA